MRNFYIKATRAFTSVRKYAWIFTLTVAFGGLWYPRLGLLVFGVIFSLTAISLFKGRYWCGNYCAHGSLFDQILLPFSRNREIPKFLKSTFTQVAVLTWFMYNLTSRFIRVAGLWGELQFLDRLGFVFVMSYLMVTLAGGTLGLIFAPRSWCQFCPMGTMQVLMYKLGKLLGWTKKHDRQITIEAIEKCHKCGKCARVCPMQLVPYTEFKDQAQFAHEACIRCVTCVEHCPAKILSLKTYAEAKAAAKKVDLAGYTDRRKIRAKITEMADLAPDTREFTMKFVEPAKVLYQPGQYFLVKIQNTPEAFRAYSISGLGGETSVRMTVKQLRDGYGTGIIFDTFAVGTEVALEGPMGHELVIDPSAKKVVLVAGGIGITPFVPILQDLAAKGVETTLVYGANTENDFIYDEVLSNLASESPRISYIKTAAKPGAGFTGQTGLVTDALRGLKLHGVKVYMCGPKGMVNASTKLLKELGVPAEAIFAESA